MRYVVDASVGLKWDLYRGTSDRSVGLLAASQARGFDRKGIMEVPDSRVLP